jgi:hypothetical protein
VHQLPKQLGQECARWNPLAPIGSSDVPEHRMWKQKVCTLNIVICNSYLRLPDDKISHILCLVIFILSIFNAYGQVVAILVKTTFVDVLMYGVIPTSCLSVIISLKSKKQTTHNSIT